MDQFLAAFKKPAHTATEPRGGPKRKNIPWIEKYRPKTVDDVSHQEEVVSVLKKSLQGSDLPNLLFYGPPGTGKTSTILAAARDLFGPGLYNDRVLELNASDERGIQVIRLKVKKFAQLTASGTRPDGKPCPPFKIIILDEADSMTNPAQAALRRTMEKESRTTRFCLICNYVTRIIEPITSRCAKFRFKPLDDAISLNRLRNIATTEGVSIDDQVLSELVTFAAGDLRRSITLLQSVARLRVDAPVTSTDVEEVAGVVPADRMSALVEAVHSMSFEETNKQVKDLLMEGFSGYQTLLQLHDFIVTCASLTNSQKAVVLERVSVADQSLMDGGDEYLQLMSVSCTMVQQLTATTAA